MASISSNVTSNSITCWVSGMSSSYEYKRSFSFTCNGETKDGGTKSPPATTSGSVTFTGLKANTEYSISCLITFPETPSASSVTVTGSATTDSITIPEWQWSFSTSSGSDFNLTATEWKEFCNRINEVRVAKQLPEYSFTTNPRYIVSGESFYVWIFNQGVSALDDMNCGVAPQLKDSTYIASGKDIYGWYFSNLKSALNNAISTI